MRAVPPLIALLLSLILAVTAQGMAFARGQAPAEGQMILYTGQGAVMVFTDADGRPTSAPQLCEDGAQAFLAMSLTAPVEVAGPAVASDLGRQFAPVSHFHAERPRLSARDPPLVWPRTRPIRLHGTDPGRTAMSIKTIAGATLAALICLPALAGEPTIEIEGAFARSGPKTGAAFFTIHNHGDTDDRLVAARSGAASRVDLHTHIEDENGVVKMRPVEDGIIVPAGRSHALERGGDHVMFMGLDAPFEAGGTVTVTLSFEAAGDIEVEIPVDNER